METKTLAKIKLFQTGYLTIKKRYEFSDNIIYQLKIPATHVKLDSN